MPRLTIRRLMIAVAVAGVILGSTVEAPRLKRRWDYCRARALIHGQWETMHRHEAQWQSDRLTRADYILRTLDAMGPEPRNLASIIEATGDTNLAGWFFRGERKLSLLYSHDPRTEGHDPSEDLPISPAAAARYIRTMYLVAWRDSRPDRIACAEMQRDAKEEYLRASWRPWLPIPLGRPF